ncbi:MAG: dUTP diphosphatase [Lachnospiraceae bacterium]|nr:dUTP diphosphatase [Lachnospiraceae bacterium]
MQNKFLITRMENAKDLKLPSYMTKGAAGMDLYANVTEDTLIKPGDIKLVPTGIKISIPEGYEAQIRPRSGLALKYGISMVNAPGTIDSDYRGEINVILINFGKEDFIVKRGERIAQMVINKVEVVDFTETDALDETERGAGGFGHTGY